MRVKFEALSVFQQNLKMRIRGTKFTVLVFICLLKRMITYVYFFPFDYLTLLYLFQELS